MQEAIFAVFFDWLGLNEYAVKIGAAVIVVILNYCISRFIFTGRKKHKKEGEPSDDGTDTGTEK